MSQRDAAPDGPTVPIPFDPTSLTPVTGGKVPVAVDYEIYAGHAMSAFLRGLKDGRLVGARAPNGALVYVPPVGVCPVTGEATTVPVDLEASGTVITYIVVHIPVRDKSIPLPYACADILLDGCETPFLGLIRGIDATEVRRGMRLRAVLHPAEQRALDMSTIAHFEPIDEPDVDVEALVAERQASVRQERERAIGAGPASQLGGDPS